ncbi:exodeoxyribonuclease VII large subunit [Methanoculleus sp. 7T]|jgi:exodeoxyribonuclease VII large subunit|uniref:exodeoxyribonuclease VII large subunit n=1 Tax=Methanoculleus sp. 7T TaxID=2937282 RepID=UPI0020BEC4F8|nr:exodeoxyribonuclease VII large subunit [Methanoculleus sp. 7T]MCK8518968.1 exodeoxyribonuclease VII large subunit [Methanoculleus sp. 7T]
MMSSGPSGRPDRFGTPILGVSEVSRLICDLLDDNRLHEIWVRGEVTNYKDHASGHRYFSLSEQNGRSSALINCVMWRTYASGLAFEPRNGMDVLAWGSVEVYEPHGRYQLIIREMLPAGLGERHLMVERWKRELEAEGLFSPERRRALPAFPHRIGVVTSPTGAAVKDILSVVSRRYPAEVILSPTAVQGDTAHIEIAEAIRRIDGLVDVIIVGRGGGSFEDLFPFNHPDVVRAVAACTTPVISAVGHEVDTALCDFAADLRAPTPSAAAERAVPDRREVLLELSGYEKRMGALLLHRLDAAGREVEDLRARMHPRRLARRVHERMQRLAEHEDLLRRAALARVQRERSALAEVRASLAGKDPLAVLDRGYCIVESDGRVIRSARDLRPGERVVLRMKDGRCKAVVEEITYDEDL